MSLLRLSQPIHLKSIPCFDCPVPYQFSSKPSFVGGSGLRDQGLLKTSQVVDNASKGPTIKDLGDTNFATINPNIRPSPCPVKGIIGGG